MRLQIPLKINIEQIDDFIIVNTLNNNNIKNNNFWETTTFKKL